MAHELEVRGQEAAFASRRYPAWHGLGEVFPEEEIVSTSEMLKKAKLNDWDVRLTDVEIPAGFDSDTSYTFVARTNPFNRAKNDILGLVGKRYVPVQNEDVFAFADNILGSYGRWETAGSLKGGRVVFGALALERETVIDPNGVSDKINTYLLINTSHDGSLAIQASITPVRVVCANTLNLALGKVKDAKAPLQSFKIRHTQTATGKVELAREALGLANAYMDEFSSLANKMFKTAVSKKQFDDILLSLFPAPPSSSARILKSKHRNKIDLINKIYSSESNKTIVGTAWGVANAITERLDWFRSGPSGPTESQLAAASGFDALTNAEKNRVFRTVLLATGQ